MTATALLPCWAMVYARDTVRRRSESTHPLSFRCTQGRASQTGCAPWGGRRRGSSPCVRRSLRRIRRRSIAAFRSLGTPPHRGPECGRDCFHVLMPYLLDTVRHSSSSGVLAVAIETVVTRAARAPLTGLEAAQRARSRLRIVVATTRRTGSSHGDRRDTGHSSSRKVQSERFGTMLGGVSSEPPRSLLVRPAGPVRGCTVLVSEQDVDCRATAGRRSSLSPCRR